MGVKYLDLNGEPVRDFYITSASDISQNKIVFELHDVFTSRRSPNNLLL